MREDIESLIVQVTTYVTEQQGITNSALVERELENWESIAAQLRSQITIFDESATSLDSMARHIDNSLA